MLGPCDMSTMANFLWWHVRWWWDGALPCPSAVARAVCSRAPSRPRCAPQLGWTVLHLAAMYGYGAVVDALLRAGADPNIRDRVSSPADE